MNHEAINKNPTTQRESFTELLGQLANNSASVVRDEIRLVIQGIRENAMAVRSGVLAVVIGLVIGFAAFLCLCAAAIIGLSSYMPPAIAAIVIGTLLFFIGVVIAYIGYRQLKKST